MTQRLSRDVMDARNGYGRAGSASYITYRQQLYAEGKLISRVTVHEPSHRIPAVREEVIHDLWARQEFTSHRLRTAAGRSVEVRDPGSHNTDGGPDFLQARIEIDGLQWIGAVEIHRRSGEWYDHRHHTDPRYNRVVLHVALQADEHTGRLRRQDDSVIPEIVLYPYLTRSVRHLLFRFYHRSTDEIYCRTSWEEVPSAVRRGWIEKLGRERLEIHMQRMAEEYLDCGDHQAVLYRHIFRALGYAKNVEPMMTLVDRLPFDRVQEFQDDPCILEAVFLGMAGFLSGRPTRDAFDAGADTYVERLHRMFHRVADRLDRPPMDPTAWRFFRLRPANFPTLRIVQGVALLKPGGLLYEDAVEVLIRAVEDGNPIKSLRDLLRAELPEFWKNHLRLDRPTKPRNPTLGRTRADSVIVNVLLPVALLYAEQQENRALSERVANLLGDLPPGRDRITRIFERMGTRPSSARMSQGLHQLYRTRCARARCLQCAIGRYVLETC